MPQYTSMLKFHTGKTHLYPVRFSWMLSIQLTLLFSKPVRCLWLEEFIYYLYQSWNYSSKTFSGWIYSVNEANTVLKGCKQKQLWSESQMAFHKQLLLSHCSVCVFFVLIQNWVRAYLNFWILCAAESFPSCSNTETDTCTLHLTNNCNNFCNY